MRVHSIAVVLLGVVLAGCRSGADKVSTWAGTSELAQNWSRDTAEKFWFTPQGSRIMPYEWFLKLEMAGSEDLFRDNGHMERLRLVTVGSPSTWNPDGLPIGMTKDPGDIAYLGLTCAACHTAQLNIQGKAIHIEGGPALFDFQTFLTELTQALQTTLKDDNKFKRFADRVGGDAGKLRTDLADWTARIQARHDRNLPTHAPGYARVDALGNILNEVAGFDLGVLANVEKADAPVSFPFIWDAHQHDFVQWNGSAPNAATGSLLRNVGEVLGVFGQLAFQPHVGEPPLPPVYAANSVQVKNLLALEDMIASLQSPLWPRSLIPIDETASAAGQQIYRQNCIGCHAILDRTDPQRRITAHMVGASEVGTDASVAATFLARKAKTGPLQGSWNVPLPQKFGAESPAFMVLRNAVFGIQNANLGDALPQLRIFKTARLDPSAASPIRQFVNSVRGDIETKASSIRTVIKGDNLPQLKAPMYKARPLNGIWATAPYLHNGSVPTLWDLLQEPEKRPKTFYVGSRRYDTTNVGYESVETENGINFYKFDTALPANSNSGHNFAGNLSDAQRRQLLEYLKTL